MSMTITEKILAQHAGLDNVVPGQLITAKLVFDPKFQANSFPPFMQELIRVGGLITYVKGRKKNA